MVARPAPALPDSRKKWGGGESDKEGQKNRPYRGSKWVGRSAWCLGCLEGIADIVKLDGVRCMVVRPAICPSASPFWGLKARPEPARGLICQPLPAGSPRGLCPKRRLSVLALIAAFSRKTRLGWIIIHVCSVKVIPIHGVFKAI